MKLCAAQIAPQAGRVDLNLNKHLAAIDQAISHGAKFVLFPELSLTGYEPTLASDLALAPSDPCLDVFQGRADDTAVAIALGVPLRSSAGIQIGMMVFRPRLPRASYAKQQLHPDEQTHFACGDRALCLPYSEHVLAPAICYESLQADHAASAARLGADVYLASVAKSAHGVTQAGEHYPQIAQRHGMVVVMANSIGPCDDFVSAGRSAIWNQRGQVVAQLEEHAEGLVIFDISTGRGKAVSI
ncbi:MAG: carbon-nitrogen hydrolase family protein [Steroidobacteraceae bacterium]